MLVIVTSSHTLGPIVISMDFCTAEPTTGNSYIYKFDWVDDIPLNQSRMRFYVTINLDNKTKMADFRNRLKFINKPKITQSLLPLHFRGVDM